MTLNILNAVLPILAVGVVGAKWLARLVAPEGGSEHLPRCGEAERLPSPGVYALLAGQMVR